MGTFTFKCHGSFDMFVLKTATFCKLTYMYLEVDKENKIHKKFEFYFLVITV